MLEKLNQRIKPKDWSDEPFCYKQTKLDGHRLTLIKTDDKLEGYGRTVKPDFEISVKYPHIVDYDWWKTYQQMPNNSMVDGEVYVIGKTSSDVSNQITVPGGSLEYSAFAVPWWNSYDKRDGSLEAIDALLKSETGERLTPFYRQIPELDTREHMLADAKMLCIEGWVLKQANYLDWYKLKPTRTLDVFVTGFIDGKGKFLGGIGALTGSCILDGVLTDICNCSGMDDETRWNIDEDKDMWRVFEVEYDCVGAKGKLRFPRFIRWRDDKPRDECFYKRSKL